MFGDNVAIEPKPGAAPDPTPSPNAVSRHLRGFWSRGVRLRKSGKSGITFTAIVYANVFAGAVTVGAEYRKIVTDAATEFVYPTVTWKVLSTGMHGHRADFILSHVTGKVDLFIDEYLRVNEAACR